MGAVAGEERHVNVTFPDDYQAEHLAGKDAVFAVEVKEVKEKRLPELDDDFAVEAGGYDSLDELRADVEERARRPTSARSRASSARPWWTPRWPRPRIDMPHDLSTRRPTRCGTGTARRSARPGVDPSATCAHRQDRGGARDRGATPRLA